jgi:LTXXQ motif family protein
MQKIGFWKLAASATVISLMLVAAAGTAVAKPPAQAARGGRPAGHPSGGHPGGAPHFNARAATPHFSAARVHASPHFSSTRPSFHSHVATTPRVTPSTVRPLATTARPLTTTARPLATGTVTPLPRTAFRSDPRSFVAHRRFAGDPAFRPFLGRGWHPYHHLGWIGPVFWPYAYGDFFYSALWPADYGYDDPFWAYGYGDIYASIFSPDTYDDYVQGPGAPARMSSLTQGMANSCAAEAAEVTGWPIDQIQAAVQPTEQQSALLDDLGNAVVKASDEVKANCPTTVAFTPTDRLGQMQQRLQTMVDTVNIVLPPLTKFYNSLSDEQKARFNDMSPPSPQQAQASQGEPVQGQQSALSPQAQCDAKIMAWPTEQIDTTVKPDDAQRAKLQALTAAAAQAADSIKAACPSEMPATPPSRLEAIGKHLQAMLQAVQTVQPALADFYNSLNDDQKARFNAMGKQLFAANQQ